MEAIQHGEDAYLLSRRQIASFKVKKQAREPFKLCLEVRVFAQRGYDCNHNGCRASRRHLPSSQRKSGRATSCRGISFRKPGRWQRGLPVTIFLLLSQSPSQASRQSQLKELAKRLLGRGEESSSYKSIRNMGLKVRHVPGSHSVERVCRVSKAPGVIVVSWLS